MTTKPESNLTYPDSRAVTYHKHLALLRAQSDKEFLEELTKLEDAGFRVAQVGKDVRFQGEGIVALMQWEPEPEPGRKTVFEFEDIPEGVAPQARSELPFDPAIT